MQSIVTNAVFTAQGTLFQIEAQQVTKRPVSGTAITIAPTKNIVFKLSMFKDFVTTEEWDDIIKRPFSKTCSRSEVFDDARTKGLFNDWWQDRRKGSNGKRVEVNIST